MRLIDADAILKDIETLKKSPWYNYGSDTSIYKNPCIVAGYYERKEAVEIIELLIEEAKTIEERKIGKWEICKDDENYCICTVCNNIIMTIERTPFCPSCGSKNMEV